MKLCVSGLLVFLMSCSVAPVRPAQVLNHTGDAEGTKPDADGEPLSNGEESVGEPTPDATPAVTPTPVAQTPVPAVSPLPAPMPAPVPAPAEAVGKDIKNVKVLLFSRTAGFRHDDCIKQGNVVIGDFAKKYGFTFESTEDPLKFTKEYLAKFDAVFFLCTTGNALENAQQTVFENYIKAGGGYMGVHSATDTEADWPWYVKLVGGSFDGHTVYDAVLTRNDKTHLSSYFLPDEWKFKDEWYKFKNFNTDVKVIFTIDADKNTAGDKPRPIVWYHEYDGGRAWYSALGHFTETWKNVDFQRHLLGGLLYAVDVKNIKP